MSGGAVASLHVRCRAAPGGERAAVARCARLVRTARLHLPAALGGALDRGAARVYVDRLEVVLDFDPEDYDDVTVAVLWAARITDAVGSLGGDVPGVHVFADGAAYAAAALDAVGRTGSLPWMFAELPCGAGAVGAPAVLQAVGALEGAEGLRSLLVTEPARARRVYDRLTAAERVALVEALSGRRRLEDWRPVPVPGTAHDGGEPRAPHDGDRGGGAFGERPGSGGGAAGRRATPGGAGADAEIHRRARGGFDAWIEVVRSAGRGEAAGGPAATVRATLPGDAQPQDRPAAARPPLASPAVRDGTGSERGAATGDELVDAVPALEGDAWWSLGGGLVLLWPWLGELLGGDLPPAPRLPGADPAVAVRMWALAGLLDDERVPFVLDPLVRLLAGDDLSADRRLGAPTEEPAGDGTPPEQAAVLRAFAAAIPGFADSSARFLREHFLRRGALVEPLGEDAVRVRLEPLPLDPILDLLPYPPGPFRLEGIPLVVVERRRT